MYVLLFGTPLQALNPLHEARAADGMFWDVYSFVRKLTSGGPGNG
jgi:hypothetical protein